MMTRTRAGALALALAVGAFGWTGAALAAPAYPIAPTTVTGTPNIGKVVLSSPSTAGVFRVAAATGAVTVQSGTLARIGSGTVTTPTFTVSCQGGNGSANRCGAASSINILIARVTSSGSAFLPAMNISHTNGPSSTCTPSGQNTATVTLNCTVPNLANNQSIVLATIKVGMDIQVGATATPTGLRTLSYTITTP